ncbi:MAG: polysaccharide biosynthesis/export family protein [Elusimicrobiota bacterium]
MSRFFYILFLSIFVLLIKPTRVLPADFIQKDITDDLSYYRRLVEKEDLSPNDRFYVLLRLYEKYKNTNLDISPIKEEISKVKPDWGKEEKDTVKQQTVEISTPLGNVSISTIASISEQTPESPSETYRISQGDILKITVYPADELSREALIRPDGMTELPLLGNVKLVGMTTKEASAFLKKGYSIYVTNPKVSVGIKYFSRQQLFLMGEIVRPGSYEYREKMRLFELVSSAGGLTPAANPKNIKIHRGDAENRKTQTVNFEDIMKSGDLSKDFILQPGDIIEVPKGMRTISVIGEVKLPYGGAIEWREEMTALDAVSAAGGPTDIASLGAVKIFREEAKQRKTIKVKLNKVMSGRTDLDVKVQPGDIVFVPKKPITSSQWFVNTLLPWLTLISLVLVLASR